MNAEVRSSRFAAVFSVDIRHSFFPDDRCSCFEVEPNPETAQTLLDHRCLLRAGPAGFTIVASLDPEGATFLPLPEGSRLRFRLNLRDTDFALITELAAMERIRTAGGTPVFTNGKVATGGAMELVSGPRSAAFAAIELVVEPGGASPAAPSEYWVPFEARDAYWAYYCVTDLPLSTIEQQKLTIVDDATDDPIVFDATLLPQVAEPVDPIAVQLATLYPDKRRIRFLSDRAVRCSAAPRKQLKLMLGTDDLLQPLPNPVPQSFCEASAPPQYRLFRIIEYAAKP